MASEPDPGHFKGPGEKPILGEGFFDPVSVNISLLLSGKVANAFLTLVDPSLVASPEAYLHELVQNLGCLQSEAYTVNLNYKLQGIEQASSKQSALFTYTIEDYTYFFSNRGYSQEFKLASLLQGPVQVIQKTGPNFCILKEPFSEQLITRVQI
ncbi:hypothetical protein DSO57_1028207 [Entomophthora muscae]|uniref:Uncharacterized protein n=1 Tax=Entomophthora muscae TaxID=34485 RepID=A0ACC2T2E5_9FUNG|nr:hypothetical protein DSO57_1028207 [Entomophthora muscae]